MLEKTLSAALDARASSLPGADDHQALRLFSGFHEGFPALTVDLYGRSLVLHDHNDEPDEATARAAIALIQARLPWVRSATWKLRKSTGPDDRNGRLLLGEPADLDDHIIEDGVRYAINLKLNRDASFYLDTRPLRAWARANLKGKSVLNTFAYTGSLGVAARAGGASRLVQVDRSQTFLDMARRSCALNSMPVARGELVAADFFEHVGRIKKQEILFDCVIVDPPFFSSTDKGRVDLEGEAERIINKARPLIADNGWLVAVNNAVYLPGAAYHAILQKICATGYLTIEALLPVPDDIIGYPSTRQGTPLTDPAPFNHSTKMAILKVKRKDKRKAGLPEQGRGRLTPPFSPRASAKTAARPAPG